MSTVIKKRAVTEVSQLQSLVADHVGAIEPGLAILDSRLLLGQATMDVIALDAHGTLVLMAVAFTADEEMLLRAVEAYSWCLEYPEAIRRLYPSAQISAAQPPRLLFVIERMPDAFHRKIKQLGFPEVDCIEVRVLEVDGVPAIFFDTLARLRRGPAAAPAPVPEPDRLSASPPPATTGRPTSVKLQRLLGGERSGPGREPGQVVSLLNRAIPRHEPSKPVISMPKAGGAIVPRLVEAPAAAQPTPAIETVPTPARAVVHIVEPPPVTIVSTAVSTPLVVAPQPEPVPAPSIDAVAAAFEAEPVLMAEPGDPHVGASALLEPASVPTAEPTVGFDGDAESELAPRLEGPAVPQLRLVEAPTAESELDPEPALMLESDPEPATESIALESESELTLVSDPEPEPIVANDLVPERIVVHEAELQPIRVNDPEPQPIFVNDMEPEPSLVNDAQAEPTPTLETESEPALTLESAPDADPELTLVVASEPEPTSVNVPNFEPKLRLISDPEPEPVLMLESSVPAEPVPPSTPAPAPAPPAAPSVFARRSAEPADRKVSFADVAKDLLTVPAPGKAAPTTTIGRRSVEEITRATVGDLTGATDKPAPAPTAFAKPAAAFKRPPTIAPASPPDPNPIAGLSKPTAKRAAPEPSPAPVVVTPPAAPAAAEPAPPSTGEPAAPQGFEGLQFPNDGVLTRQWMEFLNQMAAGR